MAYKMPILLEGRKGGMRLATFEDCLFLVIEPLLMEDLSLMQTFHKSGVKLQTGKGFSQLGEDKKEWLRRLAPR